jgi:KipI family sensor histidine kinase inhibitor
VTADTVPSASWYGDCAVAVDIDEVGARLAAAALLSAELPEHDVRMGMASLLVVAEEPDPDLLATVISVLSRASLEPAGGPEPGRVVRVPVRYEGEDLADASAALGCDIDDLVRAHQQQHWRVAMMGFAPGFGYLVPEGAHLLDWHRLPRRDQPRTSVPAGSVAIAAGMSAVYPAAMPGGWHLVGTTTVVLFEPREPAAPTLLRPGDRVVFHGVTR